MMTYGYDMVEEAKAMLNEFVEAWRLEGGAPSAVTLKALLQEVLTLAALDMSKGQVEGVVRHVLDDPNQKFAGIRLPSWYRGVIYRKDD